MFKFENILFLGKLVNIKTVLLSWAFSPEVSSQRTEKYFSDKTQKRSCIISGISE